MSTINTSSLSDHLPPALTADYLHSMKTSEPKPQQVKGYTDPSTYTPDPSSVERAHGSSAAHSPFFWGPSFLS
ncbi:hypothetical protein F511_44788 [Dorcoceras hygrometricum]|uniref:Uncharacterized protein n=1 Tax=Dorcoceras hygrometricum TaxID=472368 RepID=A0A2Z7B828_9LAMI|nr:hypothetical protein F511_44788 [Dorcoceras hygrometricum]